MIPLDTVIFTVPAGRPDAGSAADLRELNCAIARTDAHLRSLRASRAQVLDRIEDRARAAVGAPPRDPDEPDGVYPPLRLTPDHAHPPHPRTDYDDGDPAQHDAGGAA